MEILNIVISRVASFLWGVPLVLLLLGTGLYLTLLLRGVQFRAFIHAFKLVFHKEHDGDGDISHFAALMTALAATVGIGNIVGVATAITLGGPGAVFWMWATGMVGMATKYSEILLAQKYREKGKYGMRGGPMYYLKNGANMPKLATAFAIFAVIASFGIGNMTQANATAQIFQSKFGVDTLVSGIVMMTMTALVILGGIKSIGRFTSFLVPFMIIVYVGASLVVLAINVDKLPHALWLIIDGAFNGTAATGGFVGATIVAAMRYGTARGFFSNESGLGSAPIAGAAARTKDPVKQALVGMTQTFIDTLVVCTMTALIILTAPAWTQGVSAAELTSVSFAHTLGYAGVVIVAIATALFAYSTLIGWSYYGERSIEFLLGDKAVKPYRVVFVVFVLVGSISTLEAVWNFSDAANALMAIPNLIALAILAKVVKTETDRYFKEKKL
ncbi:MAG: sodium:alanine symporter family protein [Campylobacterales bacterium]|nr:sodium:alanine symporter family protein [Campylobacterales bacterium]